VVLLQSFGDRLQDSFNLLLGRLRRVLFLLSDLIQTCSSRDVRVDSFGFFFILIVLEVILVVLLDL
jgi:hypothetical protein